MPHSGNIIIGSGGANTIQDDAGTTQRDLISTHNEFALLQAMSPEDRKQYLQDNQAFLEKAGIAHYSPLAQSMLTYDNLIEKAAAIGLKPGDLEDAGFVQEIQDARTHNTQRLQSVVQRLSDESKLSVDNQDFFHKNASLTKSATKDDRAEYGFALAKMGIPAFATKGIASHLDGDVLAAANPKKFQGSSGDDYKYIKGHTQVHDAVAAAEAAYLRDNTAAAQAVHSGVVQSGLEYFSRFGAFKGENYGGVTLKDLKPGPSMDQSERNIQREAQNIARQTVNSIQNAHEKEVAAKQPEPAAVDVTRKDIKEQLGGMYKNQHLDVACDATFNNGKACVGIACSGNARDELKAEFKKRGITVHEVNSIKLKSGLQSNEGGLLIDWQQLKDTNDILPDFIKRKLSMDVSLSQAGADRKNNMEVANIQTHPEQFIPKSTEINIAIDPRTVS